MSYLLGIDVGTSGCKAVLVDEAGRAVATATRGYPLYSLRAAWAEQDPEDWWQATCESIRAVLDAASVAPVAVASVGLTGQMHGLVLLNAAGDVLRPAILWNDQRSAAECAAITETVGLRRLLDLTGNRVLPGFTAPKLLWVRAHEPEVYARVAHVLLPKDYVRYRLTGTLATDVSDLMADTGLQGREARIAGGGARSLLWQQIVADVLQLALTPTTTEGAAYGAALLAGVGAGVWPDVPTASRALRPTADVVEPGDTAELYTKLYERYPALYPALAPHFAALAAL